MDVAVKIWDKYHFCCIGNGIFHSTLPREIYRISNATLMVFICYPCYYMYLLHTFATNVLCYTV